MRRQQPHEFLSPLSVSLLHVGELPQAVRSIKAQDCVLVPPRHRNVKSHRNVKLNKNCFDPEKREFERLEAGQRTDGRTADEEAYE
ncbi:hypothetical protein F2P81_022701 [Scophthalmus maximus]|uniref:Uncharacterized protein n=1 Tax=Scophthalmus maximus TaxID=52904 RepID=A0A6A4S2C9_SCOMX|nr:hypothetical protein F2P81_022701 [Scophthalmus maximus]